MELIPILIFGAFVTGGLGYVIGNTRQRGNEGLLLGLLLGPIGWIITLLLPEQGLRCPECQGVIPSGARRCRHCAYVFNAPQYNYGQADVSFVPSTNRSYWVQRGDKAEGPFTPRQLKVLVAEGKLSAEDLCSRKGDADWYPVSVVIE